MEEVKIIRDIDEYLSIIESESNLSKHSSIYYRGQSNSSWDLVPSLFRDESNIYEKTNLSEDRMINIIRNKEIDFTFLSKKLDSITPKEMCEIFSELQHYGLPTRLLDWSENPLIDLYFSCQDVLQNKKRLENGSVFLAKITDKTYKENHRSFYTSLSNYFFELKRDFYY